MIQSDEPKEFLELAVDVVTAYVTKNSVPGSDLPALISGVHSALKRMAHAVPDLPLAPPKPAVPARRSVTDDYIVCLEDGKKFKSLKRHLRTHFNLSPDDYRAKWGLAADYPMVAPNYARARSELAKEMGLGQQRRRRS